MAFGPATITTAATKWLRLSAEISLRIRKYLRVSQDEVEDWFWLSLGRHWRCRHGLSSRFDEITKPSGRHAQGASEMVIRRRCQIPQQRAGTSSVARRWSPFGFPDLTV